MTFPQRVVFVTSVFGRGSTGPETYAHYLWERFGEDPEIEFHLVAPELPGSHARWHEAGRGSGSLGLYRRLAKKALQVAGALTAGNNRVILHVNNSNLHASLLAYDGPLWGQINDYENADLWRRATETLRRAGVRRFLALARRRWLERRFLVRQDLTLCNSDFTRAKILTEYRLRHPERIVTLHKAVDTHFFERTMPLPPDPFNRSSTTRRFVFVGGDIVRKGLDTLLQAVTQFPAGFDWSLVVVGSTQAEVMATFPHLPALRDERIKFAGTLEKEQLRRVLWNSDVFVLPSRAEAFGVALLEALAAGLPVVAAAVGGIPEIVRDPAAGILFPATNVAALAQALMKIQPWPAGPPPVVQKILESFSTRVMLARLREFYLQTAEITTAP